MKKGIHPTYNTKAKVVCACGNSFSVGSTVENIHVELCSNCHPFYTGKQKLVDTAGRVDKFREKLAKVAEASKGKRGKTAKRTAKAARRAEEGVKIEKEIPKKSKAKKEIKSTKDAHPATPESGRESARLAARQASGGKVAKTEKKIKTRKAGNK